MHLLRDAQSGVNIENCEHPCVGEPCLNNGECLPSQDSYMCSCPLGYKGHNCQKSMTFAICSFPVHGMCLCLHGHICLEKKSLSLILSVLCDILHVGLDRVLLEIKEPIQIMAEIS